MKKIKKINRQNNVDNILFKNGGNTVPSAVGTNRSYGQVIKENVEEYLDKLKGNPFAEMLFPFEDVGQGHTEAIIPYVVPGYGAVKQGAKAVKNALKESKYHKLHNVKKILKNNEVYEIEDPVFSKNKKEFIIIKDYWPQEKLEKKLAELSNDDDIYKYLENSKDVREFPFKYGGSAQFKCGGMKRVPRKKAFWGALIGAGVSALGSIITNVIGANKAKQDAEESAMKEQAIIANQNLQRKRAAEQEYYNQYNANSSVYKDLYNQINSAKMGGKFKRVKRKKAEFGLDEYGNIFNGLINSGSNIINGIIQNRTNDEIQNIRNRIISNNTIAPNYGILNFDSLKLINSR